MPIGHTEEVWAHMPVAPRRWGTAATKTVQPHRNKILKVEKEETNGERLRHLFRGFCEGIIYFISIHMNIGEQENAEVKRRCLWSFCLNCFLWLPHEPGGSLTVGDSWAGSSQPGEGSWEGEQPAEEWKRDGVWKCVLMASPLGCGSSIVLGMNINMML